MLEDPERVAEANVVALYLQDGQSVAGAEEVEELYTMLDDPDPEMRFDDPDPKSEPEPEPDVLVADPEPDPFPTAPKPVLFDVPPVSVAVTGHQVTVS